MNKSELASKVADSTGMSKDDAGGAVDAVFDAIQGALKSGDEVNVPGFGKFVVNERAARKGRNPATGQEIDIAASKAASFKAAKGLKDALN